MLWSQTQADYLAAVDSTATLVSGITDYAAPGLGTWDVLGLSGHLLRAIRTPLTYLAGPEPAGEPLPSAAAYYKAYLNRRNEGPAVADRSVAARGAAELASASPDEVPTAFASAASALHGLLPSVRADRRVQSPMGVMRIEDYLRTRNLEVAVHGVDLGRAIGTPWRPPDGSLQDALVLLTEIAQCRGSGTDLLMVLTGRSADSPPLPVLQ